MICITCWISISIGITFNSQAEYPGKEVVQELIDKNIAQDERPDGPVIVKLDEKLGLTNDKYRVLVVLRSDNTALYATEDLALAKMKFADYPRLSRSLYVVDVRQSLHFQQILKPSNWPGIPGRIAASTFLMSWSIYPGMWLWHLVRARWCFSKT